MKTPFWLPAASMMIVFYCSSAVCQQRPLLTEDPRITPPGVLVAETGMEYGNPITFTISGLTGRQVQLFANGLHFALSDRVEIQATMVARQFLDPNTGGPWRHDVGDAALSTKIKVFGETSGRPIVSWRTTVTLPNANQGSGLGLNTLRFWSSVLAGKSIGRVYVFGNVGLGILDDAIRVAQQEDVLTYGVAALVRLNSRLQLAAEVNGVDNPRLNPTPGSETGGQARLGIQFDAAGFRWDVAALRGFTNVDPKNGFVFGVTKRIRFARP